MKLKILLIGEDLWKVWMNKNKLIAHYLIYKIDEMMLKNIYDVDKGFKRAEVGKGGNLMTEKTEVNLNTRNSKIKFVGDVIVKQNLFSTIKYLNLIGNWRYNLTNLEDVQYTVYDVDEYYNWHTDSNTLPTPTIRKLSFSIGLNDPSEYEGGELDIEIHGPNIKGKRFETIVLEKNEMICFKSSLWHRVRPVTKGVRKSLVGWVRGPQFI